jgi:hypothetical protein
MSSNPTTWGIYKSVDPQHSFSNFDDIARSSKETPSKKKILFTSTMFFSKLTNFNSDKLQLEKDLFVKGPINLDANLSVETSKKTDKKVQEIVPKHHFAYRNVNEISTSTDSEDAEKTMEIRGKVENLLLDWNIKQDLILESLSSGKDFKEDEWPIIIEYIVIREGDPSFKDILLALIEKIKINPTDPNPPFRGGNFTTKFFKKYIESIDAELLKKIQAKLTEIVPLSKKKKTEESNTHLCEELKKKLMCIEEIMEKQIAFETQRTFKFISQCAKDNGKQIALSTFFLLFICPGLALKANIFSIKVAKSLQLYANFLNVDMTTFSEYLKDHSGYEFLAKEKVASDIRAHLNNIGRILTDYETFI